MDVLVGRITPFPGERSGHACGGGGLVSGVARGVFSCGGAAWVAESDGGDVVALAESVAESISFTESQPVAVSDGGGVVSG